MFPRYKALGLYFLYFSRFFLTHFLLFALLFEQFVFSAFASDLPITPDGSTNTQVTHTASGIDQINIAAPNSSGLSHNRFTDYNVNVLGQEINNFSGLVASEVAGGSGITAVTSTEIGGLVAVNPNLVESGSARVILNEVTSNNVSQLLGYVEIAGTKADLIIANPNGIVCASCGFINTAHLLMVAGKSDFDADGNLGFNLSGQNNPNLYVPLITVGGLGLDVSRVTSADIVASSVKLLSSIYGSDNTEVALRAGDGRYAYSTKEITGNSSRDNSAPVFAIDVANLASIQSGKIFLIATKEGVGVNMAGEILAAQELTISANGDVFYSSLSSGNKLNISSTHNISSLNSNAVLSGPNLTIKGLGSSANFTNLGVVLADDLKILGINQLNNYGNIIAIKDLRITTVDLKNYLEIYSDKDSSITATNSVINSGEIFAVRNLSLTTSFLNNSSQVFSSSGVSSSSAGHLISGSSLSINLGVNDYDISGDIFSNSIDITAGNITNNAKVSALTSITLNAANNITNNLGAEFIAGTSFSATAANLLENYGTIKADTDIALISTNGDVNNYGAITGESGVVIINAANGAFNNLGSSSLLTSDNDLTFNVKDLNNYGEISVANNLIANVSNNFTNHATALIWSNNDLTFNVANNFLNDRAEIFAEKNLTIQKSVSLNPLLNKTASVQNVSGTIYTGSGDILIKAESFSNKRYNDVLLKRLKTPFLDEDWQDDWTFNADYHDSNYESVWHRKYWGTTELNPNVSKAGSIFSARDLTIESTGFENIISDISSVRDTVISYNAGSFKNISYHDYVGDIIYDYVLCAGCNNDGNGANRDIYPQNGARLLETNSSIKSGRNMTIFQDGVAVDVSLINDVQHNLGADKIDPLADPIHSGTLVNGIDTYLLAQNGVLEVDLTKIIDDINSNNGSLDPILDGSFKIILDGSQTVPLIEARSQFTDISKFFGSRDYFNALGLNGTQVLANIDLQTRRTSATRMLGDSFVETKLILDKLKTLTNNSFLLSLNTNDANAQIKELIDNAIAEFNRLGLSAEDVAINGLSAAQRGALIKDIVTFESTVVNGINVLAPKIYLSTATLTRLLNSSGPKSLATNSTIFAGGNLTINSPNTNLTNNGSIISSGNMNITVASLINKSNFSNANQAQIKAGFSPTTCSSTNCNLTITATNDIKNIGANISAVNNLTLTSTNGNILNTALIRTNDAALLNANSDSYVAAGNVGDTRHINSTFLSAASISGGSVTINAANDFTNLAAEITTNKNTLSNGSSGTTTTSGNLIITAGDDITVGTLQLHNHSETTWGNRRHGGTIITDSVENLGSNVTTAGSVNLVTTGLGTDAESNQALALYNQQQTELTSLQTQLTQLQAQQTALQLQYGNSFRESFLGGGWQIGNQITNVQNQIAGVTQKYNALIAPLIPYVGSNVNIIGSNITAGSTSSGGDININADNDINITNAVNSNYREENSHKRGSVKNTKSVQIDYVETAEKSVLSAENINLSSNNNILIQGSDLNTTNNLTVGTLTLLKNPDGSYQTDGSGNFLTTSNNTVNNLTIQNATLNENHYSHTTRGYHGIGSVGANIASTVMGLTNLGGNLTYNLMNRGIAGRFLDDVAPGMLDKINDRGRELSNNSLYNLKVKNYGSSSESHIVSSNLNIGNNLDINTSENTVIRASIINAGVADTTVDKSDNAIEGSINITTKNLSILADQSVSQETHDIHTTRTLMFSNNSTGNIKTDIFNSEIVAKNGNFNTVVSGDVTLLYDAKSFDSVTNTITNPETNPGLNYLTTFSANSIPTLYNPVDEVAKQWDDTNRGLTAAGTALIVIAVIAASILTAGAAGVAVAGSAAAASATVTTGTVFVSTVGVAMATSAATTLSLSMTNTSMNADGSIWNQTKDIGHQGLKDVTSTESLKSMMIAGITAGLVYGAGQLFSSGSTAASGTTMSASGEVSGSGLPTSMDAGSTSLASNTSGLTSGSSSFANVGNIANGSQVIITSAPNLMDRFLVALQNSAVQTIASSVAQSTVNGDSLGDSLKNSWKNLLINAVGQVAANDIGIAAHSGNISTTEQLALHGILGCGMAIAGGNNCASGAAAGIAGEAIGAAFYNNGHGLSIPNTLAVSQMSGGLAAAMIGGPDDGGSVFAGGSIGYNAAANNLTMVITGTDKDQKRSSSKDLDPEFKKDVEKTFDEKLTDFEWTGGNTTEARYEAAVKLNGILKDYEFTPGEKFNLIGFSHGGNVLKEFTQIYEGEKKIDNVIFLGTPHRSDYQLDLKDLSFYANRISVSDVRDGVQTRGYIDGSVYMGAITIPQNIRMMPGFINIRADQNLGAINNHINLTSPKIWTEKVEPVLINK